ncbi:hypothetical protein Tco_0848170 [Tanacetum coccineum]
MLARIYEENGHCSFVWLQPLEQDLVVAHKQQRLAPYDLKNIDLEGRDEEVVGWVEDDDSLSCCSSTSFETRHPFQTRHKRKRNDNNQTRGGLNKKLKRGVTFKRKVVKQKSVGKGEEKVSEGEAALGEEEKGCGTQLQEACGKGKRDHG